MLLLTLLSCGWYANHLNVPADPADKSDLIFDLPKGSTARAAGPLLEQAGVVDSGDDFAMYVRLTKDGGCIKAGKHRLTRAMDPASILKVLCGAPIPDDVPFTVVEGWRIREIDAALAEKGLIQAGVYAALASQPASFHADYPLPTDTLEGYLFPETYMITPDRFDPAVFIQRQLDLLGERFATPHAADWAARGLPGVVIMASMLEREEPKAVNRPLVAGILWKRIDSGWNLGVDATSRYTLQDWNERSSFLKKLRDPEDPYNTRLRAGLPPTAIGNPGIEALVAASKPVESEFWYYLHDGQQNIHPAKSAAEHEAFRRQYNVY